MTDSLHAVQAVEVAPSVVCIGDPAGTLGRSNSVVVTAGGRTTVVDTLLTPLLAGEIRRVLDGRAVHADVIVNTHPHIDHVGGNAALPEARVVASAATAAMVATLATDTGFLADRFPAFASELRTLDIRIPDTVDAERDLPSGVELIELGHAHSPGDLALWLPDVGVLIGGDVCFRDVTPLALPGHADIQGWAAALSALSELNPKVVVPGHGSPGDARPLSLLQRYFDQLQELATDVISGAMTTDEAVDALGGLLPGWAEPGRHAVNLKTATAAHAAPNTAAFGRPQMHTPLPGPGDGARDTDKADQQPPGAQTQNPRPTQAQGVPSW